MVGDQVEESSIEDICEPTNLSHTTGRTVTQDSFGKTTEDDVCGQCDDHRSQLGELGQNDAVKRAAESTGNKTGQNTQPHIASGVVNDTQYCCRQADVSAY